MKIKSVIYNLVKRTVTVFYKSGAIRTYRGRVPFTVCEYHMSINYQWGYNDHAAEIERENEEVF